MDASREVRKRIADATLILTRLHLFFRQGDSTIPQKITAMDAILRAKVLYGLDTLALNDSTLASLDVFQ
eukprot:7145673-Prorocentrum_lima.AAC.1